jgi:hydrogenase maturation factor
MSFKRIGKVLPAGKLPAGLLTALLEGVPGSGPGVVVGARYGEDAAVVDVGGRYLVLAMDPVTLSAEPGRIAVQINANDVAVMGAEPRWLLASFLLPPGSTDIDVQRVMDQLRVGCLGLGVSLIGGHTEISPSVTHPVVAACMIGEVAPDRLITSAGAMVGDQVLLAGAIAVEGTGILAREYADALRSRGVSDEWIREGAALLDDPGISVLPAIRALMTAAAPHSMHDPTEGGIVTSLRELVATPQAGVRVDVERIPVLPSCRAICDALELEPLSLLASGSLLAALAPADVAPARQALSAAGIVSAAIATIVPGTEGMTMVRDGVEEPLPEVERDELARWVDAAG